MQFDSRPHRARSELNRSERGLRVGIDLDNTLIDYDSLFVRIARERGLVTDAFRGSKRDLRDHVRLLSDGELEWQRLQARAYGPDILGASIAAGALDFIRRAREAGVQLSVVSHKTARASMSAEVDLRDAARRFLRANGLVGPGAIRERDVYFEDTRAEKIARIVELGCTHFIDDLEEVFEDAAFPAGVERLLLCSDAGRVERRYKAFTSFHEISDALIAR